MDFARLFSADRVAIVDDKSAVELQWMTQEHARVLENKPTDLIRYLTNFWAVIRFTRSNRDLSFQQAVEFKMHDWCVNCYWWPILCATATCTKQLLASSSVASKEEKEVHVFVFNLTRCIALVNAVLDIEKSWVDRTDEKKFKADVAIRFRELKQLLKTVRVLTAVRFAWLKRDAEDMAMERAKCYKLAYELSAGKEQSMEYAAKALLEKSIHHWFLSERRQAIRCARAYETIAKDLAHPHLQEWMQKEVDQPEERGNDWKSQIEQMDSVENLFKNGKSMDDKRLFVRLPVVGESKRAESKSKA